MPTGFGGKPLFLWDSTNVLYGLRGFDTCKPVTWANRKGLSFFFGVVSGSFLGIGADCVCISAGQSVENLHDFGGT